MATGRADEGPVSEYIGQNQNNRAAEGSHSKGHSGLAKTRSMAYDVAKKELHWTRGQQRSIICVADSDP